MTTTTTTITQTPPPLRLIDISVSGCSSESEVYKSNNVLLDDTYRIWQTKEKTDKSFIELQFSTPSYIKAIEVANAGSVYIEILVGLVTWEPTEFQVLVPLTNFMNFSESTNRTNRNKVKRFDVSNFSNQTIPRKWERVRIICTQPWTLDNIGISSVRIYGPQTKQQQSVSRQSSNSALLLNSSKNEDISATDTSMNAGDTSVETDPNVELKSDKTKLVLPMMGLDDLKNSTNSKKNTLNRSTTIQLSNPLPGKVVVIKPTTNTNIQQQDETEEEDENEKIEIKKKIQKQRSKLVEPKVIPQESMDDQMQIDTMKPSKSILQPPTNTNDGETDEECDNLQVISTPKKQVKLTSFGDLLKGVVLVIGGIVNPEKSEIRDKALEMGAQYNADWTRDSTHLVTPFDGTPKFNTAKKAGGSIIKPKWIHDCYKLKTRLPIREYSSYKRDESDGDNGNEDGESRYKVAKPKSNKSISTDSKKKRKKKGAPGSDDSDDDSHIPNVYDYNDGFIDNSFSSSEASSEKDPDQVEFVSENVDDLLKDGLDYLKRTYNYKPDREIQHNTHHHKKHKSNHQDRKYKDSSSYKPNKYYNEQYDTPSTATNKSTTTTTSSSPNNNSNNNNNNSNGNSNSNNSEKEERIKYTPKQSKPEVFDDDLLFNQTHDTIEMTPEQVKDEIDRIVKNNGGSDEKSLSSSQTASTASQSTTTTKTTKSKSAELSSPPKSNVNNNSNIVAKVESIPENCQTELPKHNPQDFKGKEYILNPLPSFFEGFEFYLSIKEEATRKNITRLIIAYKGEISTIPTTNTKFIITDKPNWDRLFDITKQKYPNVLFLGPSFVMQCHNYQKLVSVDKHLITKK